MSIPNPVFSRNFAPSTELNNLNSALRFKEPKHLMKKHNKSQSRTTLSYLCPPVLGKQPSLDHSINELKIKHECSARIEETAF